MKTHNTVTIAPCAHPTLEFHQYKKMVEHMMKSGWQPLGGPTQNSVGEWVQLFTGWEDKTDYYGPSF